MFVDFATEQSFEPLRADVCVIGAGAAGTTLARELIRAGHEIVLLESGGLDQEKEIDALMEGENEGFNYYPLHESRLRFFGGTTSIWGGRCAEMDDVDFRTRDWVPHSGWPINKEDLRPYYDRARAVLELEPFPANGTLYRSHNLKETGFDPAVIDTGLWQFDTKADRFAAGSAKDLFDSNRIRVLVHATVTGIRARGNGRSIDSVEFANLAGGRGEVRARFIVLAAGGLENPRLMLASNDVHAHGLGNGQDLVGRFFMEHPHARGAAIETPRVWATLNLFPRSYRRHGRRYAVVGRPAEPLQRKEALLNSSFTISVRQPPDEEMVLGKKVFMDLKHGLRPSRSKRALWHVLRKTILWSRERVGPALGALQVKRGRYGVFTVVRAEQSPNPESRVRLTRERDALGMPKLRLQWRFQEIDKYTVARTMLSLDSELQRLGLGRAIPEPWLSDPSVEWKTDPLISNHPIGGYHHMGTTRMASTPAKGVVDTNANVFGIDNLYVAGSSVFATSGWANPTLTILALSMRLADHLDARLRRRSGPVC